MWSPAYEEDGVGEHSLLLIEKQGQNTQWVARQIAQFAGVRSMDVGFHGLKDRQSVSTQWFSVYSGKRKVPEWRELSIPSVKLLAAGRFPRKLRRGQHWGNRFNIVLRDIEGDSGSIEDKFKLIRLAGFPNYFGWQRFGHQGNNLRIADSWLRCLGPSPDRKMKGIVLSAARSYLFNLILERRVLQNTWSEILPGDRLVSADFSAQSALFGCCRFVASGPMLGGEEFLHLQAGDIERRAVSGYSCWLKGLHREGVRTARRPLVAFVKNFCWSFTNKTINVQFDLAPGVYASMLLGQVFRLLDSKDY